MNIQIYREFIHPILANNIVIVLYQPIDELKRGHNLEHGCG
jgi:hypothetical protein